MTDEAKETELRKDLKLFQTLPSILKNDAVDSHANFDEHIANMTVPVPMARPTTLQGTAITTAASPPPNPTGTSVRLGSATAP